MLKKSSSFVLDSSKSSTYPTREKSCSDSSGWVGENRHASGFDSPAALLTAILSILNGELLLSQTHTKSIPARTEKLPTASQADC